MKIDEQSIAHLTAQEKEILGRLLNAVMQPKNVPQDWTDEKEGRFLTRLEDGTLREMFNDLLNSLPPVHPAPLVTSVTEADRLVREYLEKTEVKE